MENIVRSKYLNRAVSLLDKEMMVFLIGQRRVGKSFILRQLRDWLRINKPEANTIYINKEDTSFDQIKSYQDLVEYVDSKFVVGKRNYLLIDEVQEIEQYEIALRSFHTEDRLQIVATGSNADVFSTELSTRLSGRYIEMQVYSLTYAEFLTFHGLEDSDESLISYLRVGGLPALRNFNISDIGEVRSYLQAVYNTIMLKDVVQRNKVRNVEFINNLARFLGDNVGKLISTASISRFMKGGPGSVAENTIVTYLSHLNSSLLVQPVSRYDIHGKRLFETLDKYYFSDHGLRNCICGFKLESCVEKIMENAVWHHLICCGFDVTVGVLRAGEIDFVAERGEQRMYVQVAFMIASEETRKREFGNLMRIRDNYPKYVVSMTPMLLSEKGEEGIVHINLRKFLLTEF